jgi:hypothetical protein
MLWVFDSALHCEVLYSLMKISNWELECILLMNTLKDVCELQQHELNLILKDYWSKISVKYLTSDWFC